MVKIRRCQGPSLCTLVLKRVKNGGKEENLLEVTTRNSLGKILSRAWSVARAQEGNCIYWDKITCMRNKWCHFDLAISLSGKREDIFVFLFED